MPSISSYVCVNVEAQGCTKKAHKTGGIVGVQRVEELDRARKVGLVLAATRALH